MKKFKKLTASLLTAMLTLSMCATSVSAAETDATETFDVVKANEKVAVVSDAAPDAPLTESAQIEVHQGDKVNLWVELTLPENSTDVAGWTIDMYYDNAMLATNNEFADGNGFAVGTNAVDYVLGLSDVATELPGSGIAQCAFKDGGEISVADLNFSGLDFAGKTTKVVCVQLDAIADGTTTLSYRMRELVDANFNENSYVDLNTYQPIGGAEYTLNYDVVCDHVVQNDVTLKLAVPTAELDRFNWEKNEVVLYYGMTNVFADASMLPLTATNEKYYTEDTGSNKVISGGSGWTVYEVVIPSTEISAVENSSFVGFGTSDGVNRTTIQMKTNVLKAGIDEYKDYASTITPLAELDQKIFIIKDALWGEKSSTSFMGYWITDFNTIRFAAPVGKTQNSTWDDVEFYYAKGGKYADAPKIPMINTLETTKITEPGSDYLKAGNWYVYAVSVDSNTAKAIEEAKYSGFAKPVGSGNKTEFIQNVLKAKVDEFDGTYLDTAKTLDEVEGMIFVVQAPSFPTSMIIFNGEWQTEAKYTIGNDDLVTIKFSAPIGTTAVNDWNNGVELYYGDTSTYTSTNRIPMTKTNETILVSVEGTSLESVVSGDWAVYEVKLTLDQVKAIDKAKAVGFIKAGSWNKTTISFYRTIAHASKAEDVTAYGVRESIEVFDNFTFVINGYYNPPYETTSYMGSWVA